MKKKKINQIDTSDIPFRDLVKILIKKYLMIYPGATKDTIYDFVTTNLFVFGRMEKYNFDEILQEVAEGVHS